MTCPRCRSSEISRRCRRTSLGYRTFACRACRSVFNERTGTAFNDLQHPTDIVLLAVLWRLRYKLSFRDVAEMLLQRGFAVTHETVREWEFRFAPLLTEQLRAKRRGRAGGSLTRFSGQFTCRHHAASAAAAGLLSYSTGLRSPIEV